MSFGLLNVSRSGTYTQTTAPSEQTAALLFMRKLQESERHRTLLNYFAFYEGTHYSYLRDPAEPLITINYAQAFIDISNSFLFGNGFSFQSDDGEDSESPELDALNQVWVDADKDQFSLDMGTMGHVAGDVFVKITYVPETDKIVLVLLDTQTCFPIFSAYNREEFESFKIEYLINTGGAGDFNDVHLYTEIYKDDMIQVSWDGEISSQFPNPFPFIPIVHLKNKYNPRSYYGQSDLRDHIPLNKIFNEQTTKFQDIVNYHAEPVTIIYGARMNNLTKGARKVWSGLPATARIENLQLQTDLPALQTFIDRLKTQMHEISGIPEHALGQEQAVSNTSNAALQTMYLPLINKTNQKRIYYGHGIKKINEYILRIWQQVRGGVDPKVNDTTTIEWESPVPKDTERVISQEIVPLMQMQLITREHALKMIGIKNPKKMLDQVSKELVEFSKIQGQIAENSAPPMALPGGANGAQQNPKEQSDSQKEKQQLPGGESK